VGGNYFGEWSLDVKDFAEKSYDPIYRLYNIAGFNTDTDVERFKEAFPMHPVLHERDEFSLARSFNDTRNADCGNVAVTRLHELLPNIPGRNMLGADYFAFDCATALGMPSVHHTRPVFHEYDADRFDYEHKLKYWEGVARFVDYFNTYGPLLDAGLGRRFAKRGPVTIDENVVKNVLTEMPTLLDADRAARTERIVRVCDVVLIPFDERYAKLGRALRERAPELVRECDEDYENHARLIERWPDLISRARELPIQEHYVEWSAVSPTNL
jgi:hypothetical protein